MLALRARAEQGDAAVAGVGRGAATVALPCVPSRLAARPSRASHARTRPLAQPQRSHRQGTAHWRSCRRRCSGRVAPTASRCGSQSTRSLLPRRALMRCGRLDSLRRNLTCPWRSWRGWICPWRCACCGARSTLAGAYVCASHAAQPARSRCPAQHLCCCVAPGRLRALALAPAAGGVHARGGDGAARAAAGGGGWRVRSRMRTHASAARAVLTLPRRPDRSVAQLVLAAAGMQAYLKGSCCRRRHRHCSHSCRLSRRGCCRSGGGSRRGAQAAGRARAGAGVLARGRCCCRRVPRGGGGDVASGEGGGR